MDIRIELLENLRNLNKGTTEFIANDFLSKLNSDLGTIKRLLIELIESDLIQESNVYENDLGKSVIRNIDTTAHDEDPEKNDKKNSKRLIQAIGKCNKISSIRIMITLKGINFLIENEKLKNELVLTKWQKYGFWPIAIIAFTGLIISVISLFVKIRC
jgi:hypothetical protein